MMKYKIYASIGAFLLVQLMTFAQQKEILKAEKKFNDYAFVDAIASYERLVEKGFTSEEIFKKLGNANYLDAKYKKASEWYGKLFELKKAKIEPEYLYRYAQTLKSMGNYGKSNEWMEKFEAAKSTDSRAIKFAQNRDYLKKIKENSGRYDIKNMTINSMNSDFAPSFLGDMLIFSSARDTGITNRSVNRWDNKPFLNLYGAKASGNGEFAKATKFSKALNSKTHESSTAFTKDGKTVYFTRNNSKKNGGFARDKEGISRLKIYRATLQNALWGNIIALPFNSDDHSAAHPTLSADETILYFSSDMEGTFGESDIFEVDILTNGNFGVPHNLGDKINTEGRETFPYITDSNILYFASDGHPGLGGLDVFATNMNNKDKLIIENLGGPVNTDEDDFSFIINEKNNQGFFASNREGGIGGDDIYRFVENRPLKFDCNSVVEGTVKQIETGQPLSGAKVILFNNKGEKLAETISSDIGEFSFDGDCRNGNFRLVATKADYLDGVKTFEVSNEGDTIGADIELTKELKLAGVGTDLAEILNIKRIYFDYDKSVIRKDAELSLQKILAYMNKFPQVNIEVRSHTDSRASSPYNDRLSKRRSKATVAYLIKNGIDNSRVTGQGFGETKLTNNCADGVECSEDEHQLNRRSEFIVVN